MLGPKMIARSLRSSSHPSLKSSCSNHTCKLIDACAGAAGIGDRQAQTEPGDGSDLEERPAGCRRDVAGEAECEDASLQPEQSFATGAVEPREP